MALQNPRPIITTHDQQRLYALLENFDQRHVELLESELERARVVSLSELPADVVTMNSVVSYIDEKSGLEKQIALVYPRQADASSGRVSVLAPMGAALLGVAVGQSIELPLPGGRSRRVRVTAVSFQPEAHGAFDL